MIDAGGVRAHAELDLGAWDKMVAKLQQDVGTIDKTLQNVKPAQPKLDTSELDRGHNTARGILANIQSLFSKDNLTARLNVDTAQAEEAVGVFRKTISSLVGDLGVLRGLGGVGGVLGAGSAIAILGAMTVALERFGAEWKSFQLILQRTTGESGAGLAQLQADFRDAFSSVPADGGDLARALSSVHTLLGLSGAQSTAFLADVAKLSAFMGGDLVTNTKAVIGVFEAWDLPLAQSHESMGLLISAAQLTNQNVTELAHQLRSAAPIAKEFGLSFTETAALLHDFERAGVDSGAALFSMRHALGEAAKGGADLDTFLQDAIQTLAKETDQSKQAAEAQSLFGRQYAVVLALIKEGKLNYQDEARAIEGHANALDKAYPATVAFQLQLQKTEAAIGPLAQNLRETLLNALNRVLQGVDGVTRGIALLAESPAWQQLLQVLHILSAIPGPLQLLATTVLAAGAAADLANEQQNTNRTLIDAQQAQADAARAAAEHEKAQRSDAEAAENAAKGFRAQAGAVQQLTDALARARTQGEISVFRQQIDDAKALDAGISQLVDKSIADYLQSLKNLADSTTDAAVRQEALAQGAEVANAHLTAQEDTHKRDAAAASELANRYDALATASMPRLDLAAQQQVKSFQAVNDHSGAARVALAALGVNLDDLEPAVRGRAEDFKKLTDSITEASKRAPTLADLFKQATNALDSEKVARDAALIKDSVKFLSEGFVAPAPPPVKDAVAQYADALQKAHDALNDANKKAEEQLAQATRGLAEAAAKARAASTQAESTFQKTMDALDKEARKIEEDLAKALAAINQGLSNTLAGIAKQAADANKAYQKTVDDANKAYVDSVKQAQEQYASAIEALQGRAAAAFETASQSERAALGSLAQALDNLRQQNLAALNSFSVAMEDLNARALAAGQTAEEQSRLAQERIRLQATEGFRQTAQQSQEQQAREAFTKAINDAIKNLGKELAGIAADAGKAQDAIGKAITAAQEAQAVATKAAADQLEKALKELNAAAERAYSEALAARIAAAKDAEQKKKDLEEKRKEAAKALEDAQQKARDDYNKAVEKFVEEQKKIKDDQQKALERFFKEASKAEEDRKRADDRLKEGLEKLATLAEEQLHRSRQEVQIPFSNNQFFETSVDFLKAAVDRARERLKAM